VDELLAQVNQLVKGLAVWPLMYTQVNGTVKEKSKTMSEKNHYEKNQYLFTNNKTDGTTSAKHTAKHTAKQTAKQTINGLSNIGN
jgi:hypothetical protein